MTTSATPPGAGESRTTTGTSAPATGDLPTTGAPPATGALSTPAESAEDAPPAPAEGSPAERGPADSGAGRSVAARRRGLTVAGRLCTVLFLAMAFGRPLAGSPEWWRGWWAWPVLVAAVWLTWAAGRVGTTAGDAGTAAPVEVDPPVRGRWSAMNSPANRVPSHGTRTLAQAYAIDIVAEPEPGARPRFGWWPPVRRNTDFPAFGAPLLAVGDATVVRVRDGHRDHLSRNSWLLLPYFLLVEGAVRSIGGPGRIIGNHLVLDLGGGVHALYAHLRQGSARVREGERVRAGQPLAECGDSGNSTEPHLHFQLQDHPDPQAAQGLPFRWRGIGVPRNRETFTVPDPD